MVALLRLIPWPVWAGGGALVLASLAGYGAWMFARGGKAYEQTVLEQIMERTREVRSLNHEIDKRTIEDDARLALEIKRLEDKWRSKPSP